jgi:hypothetical protein
MSCACFVKQSKANTPSASNPEGMPQFIETWTGMRATNVTGVQAESAARARLPRPNMMRKLLESAQCGRGGGHDACVVIVMPIAGHSWQGGGRVAAWPYNKLQQYTAHA